MKVYDISPCLSEETAVFPGDQKFSRKVSMDFEKKDHLTLSSMQTTLHIGAHTDAPNHYHASGVGMSARDLNYYFGECQVVRVRIEKESRILVSHLDHVKISSKRILFRTDSFLQPNQWTNDFVSLSAELVHFLASRGVVLVGIDTPSIDLAEDKELESHNAIFANDMAILEGIVLDQVNEGRYFLSALPLKILNADASPVRAILVEGTPEELWNK